MIFLDVFKHCVNNAEIYVNFCGCNKFAESTKFIFVKGCVSILNFFPVKNTFFTLFLAIYCSDDFVLYLDHLNRTDMCDCVYYSEKYPVEKY